MREDIAEQLGVTPTLGGLEVLLRQSENNRMASGGIVNMANGGSAIKEFGQILKGVAPSAIAGGITGGLFPIMKWGANQLAGNYGGTGIRQRLLNELGKNYDPFGDGAMTTDQYYDAIDNIENMSTDQLQKEIEGNPSIGNILTGFRSAGCRIRVVYPIVQNVIFETRVIVDANFDVNETLEEVKQAAISFVNSRDVGEELRIADMTRELMTTQNILSVAFFQGLLPMEDIFTSSGKEVIRIREADIEVTSVF